MALRGRADPSTRRLLSGRSPEATCRTEQCDAIVGIVTLAGVDGRNGLAFRVHERRFQRRYAEQRGQAGLADGGQPHRARIALPHDPAQVDTAATDLDADPACEVIAPLTPVEAGLAEDALAPGSGCQIRTHPQSQHTAGNQGAGDRRALSGAPSQLLVPKATSAVRFECDSLTRQDGFGLRK